MGLSGLQIRPEELLLDMVHMTQPLLRLGF